MLTTISTNLINHYLGKSDITSLIKDPLIKQLFYNLQSHYQNTKVNVSHDYGSYPHSDFIVPSLSNKLSQRNNILTLRWITKGNHEVQNILHIYINVSLS